MHMLVLCVATASQPPQWQDNAAFAQRIHQSFTNLTFPPAPKELLEINIFIVSFLHLNPRTDSLRKVLIQSSNPPRGEKC